MLSMKLRVLNCMSPIYRGLGDRATKQLQELIRPFLLRRTIMDVAASIKLPPRDEITLLAGISETQKKLYKALLMKNVDALLPHARNKSSTLNLLMQLRKCSNHPYLFDGIEPEPFAAGEHLVTASGKLMVLDKLLKHLHANGHRVLLFSQMAHMLDILQDYLSYRGWNYERLDGSVRGEERYAAVNSFSESCGAFVFLLSTRAGGQGLTLTAADTVIFFDSDFNPQNDLQAAARAHRLGQDRPVKVIRLLAAHTVDEIIFKRAMHKLTLTKAVVADGAYVHGSGGAAAAASGGANDDVDVVDVRKDVAGMADILSYGLGELDKPVVNVDIDVRRVVGSCSNGRWDAVLPAVVPPTGPVGMSPPPDRQRGTDTPTDLVGAGSDSGGEWTDLGMHQGGTDGTEETDGEDQSVLKADHDAVEEEEEDTQGAVPGCTTQAPTSIGSSSTSSASTSTVSSAEASASTVAEAAHKVDVVQRMEQVVPGSIHSFMGTDYAHARKSADIAALKLLVRGASGGEAMTSRPIPSSRTTTTHGSTPTLTSQQHEERAARRKLHAAEAKERAARVHAIAADKRAKLWADNGYTSHSVGADESTATTTRQLLADGGSDDDGSAASAASAASASTVARVNSTDSDVVMGGQLQFVFGDVTRSAPHGGNSVVVLHNVNDSGTWGRGGLFDAIVGMPGGASVAHVYSQAGQFDDLHLGDVHVIPLNPGPSSTAHPSVHAGHRTSGRVYVALLVCQPSRGRDTNRIVHRHLATCLGKVQAYVRVQCPVSGVHMPRIGHNTRNFNWYGLERLLRKHLCAMGTDVHVHYYQRRARASHGTAGDGQVSRQISDASVCDGSDDEATPTDAADRDQQQGSMAAARAPVKETDRTEEAAVEDQHGHGDDDDNNEDRSDHGENDGNVIASAAAGKHGGCTLSDEDSFSEDDVEMETLDPDTTSTCSNERVQERHSGHIEATTESISNNKVVIVPTCTARTGISSDEEGNSLAGDTHTALRQEDTCNADLAPACSSNGAAAETTTLPTDKVNASEAQGHSNETDVPTVHPSRRKRKSRALDDAAYNSTGWACAPADDGDVEMMTTAATSSVGLGRIGSASNAMHGADNGSTVAKRARTDAVSISGLKQTPASTLASSIVHEAGLLPSALRGVHVVIPTDVDPVIQTKLDRLVAFYGAVRVHAAGNSTVDVAEFLRRIELHRTTTE